MSNDSSTHPEYPVITIMGIDPGLSTTGIGIIKGENRRIEALYMGHITTKRAAGLADRLQQIYREIDALVKSYKPDEVAVEQVFVAHNAKSALKLGHARGVAMMTAFQYRAHIAEYSALEVKKAIVGTGRADKHQVQIMVQHLLGLAKVPQPTDAADALAIAICHYHTLTSRLNQATMYHRSRAR